MRISYGQNIFDVAIQELGTLELLFDEILIPNKISVNSKLNSGQEIILSNYGKGDESVKDYFRINNIQLNNGQDIQLPPVIGGAYSSAYGAAYN